MAVSVAISRLLIVFFLYVECEVKVAALFSIAQDIYYCFGLLIGGHVYG